MPGAAGISDVVVFLGRGEVAISRQRLDPVVDTKVAVRMLFAPINPADMLAIDADLPDRVGRGNSLGAEGVGIVEEVGDAVTQVRRGDRVLPLSRGNWARVRVVDESDLIVVPADIPPQQAAMLRINPATALLLLDRSAAAPGAALLMNGARSRLAHWMRFFAAEKGYRLIGVVRSSARQDDTDNLLDDEGLSERVRERGPVGCAFDCVAGPATARLADCIAPHGKLIVFGQLSKQPCVIPPDYLTGRGLRVEGFALREAEKALTRAEHDQLFGRIFAAARVSGNSIAISDQFPLSGIARALHAARHSAPGRVLLDLSP